jgi:hypothetical protein
MFEATLIARIADGADSHSDPITGRSPTSSSDGVRTARRGSAWTVWMTIRETVARIGRDGAGRHSQPNARYPA